jgi:hypothetical protein
MMDGYRRVEVADWDTWTAGIRRRRVAGGRPPPPSSPVVSSPSERMEIFLDGERRLGMVVGKVPSGHTKPYSYPPGKN